MNVNYVIEGKEIKKKFKGFVLNIEELKIPKGFSTALIGENGAGKTTLINILVGIRLDHKGTIRYFDEFDEKEREEGNRKERIGYVGSGNFYLPQWKVSQVEAVNTLLFEGFHKDRFRAWCKKLAIFGEKSFDGAKKVNEMSDGNRMKLMLANVFARDTDCLILDEPASPLDPLMRDKLCEMIREYIEDGDGERSVLFSTHNISDMENVTDYAIFMEKGKIVEEGFIEDLKEKYIVVKGEAEDIEEAKKLLFSIHTNTYGFEGICLAKDMDKLANMNISCERPNLYQISVAIMQYYSYLT
ncbi:MAG: ABC transporter ATP-binding protein [Lachnospiraceae bacterium]|nr:ABC transporter ATP-binding protein [Lachnospiraceae bacterium]